MTARSTQIGIDRLVRLKWLERTSALVLAGNAPKEVKSILENDICHAFRSGKTERRGSLGKTITILMKVWQTAPRELMAFRLAGLELLKHIPQQERRAIHWGMVMAVYPFWGSVASQVGRLIKIQGTVVASQIQRRMREQYGERETVSRRARYVLRSFVDWDVLRETESAGVYEQMPQAVVARKDIATWLIEAAILSRSKGPISLKSLTESTSLFPFHLVGISADEISRNSTRLDVIKHSLDEELVLLKVSSVTK